MCTTDSRCCDGDAEWLICDCVSPSSSCCWMFVFLNRWFRKLQKQRVEPGQVIFLSWILVGLSQHCLQKRNWWLDNTLSSTTCCIHHPAKVTAIPVFLWVLLLTWTMYNISTCRSVSMERSHVWPGFTSCHSFFRSSTVSSRNCTWSHEWSNDYQEVQTWPQTHVNSCEYEQLPVCTMLLSSSNGKNHKVILSPVYNVQQGENIQCHKSRGHDRSGFVTLSGPDNQIAGQRFHFEWPVCCDLLYQSETDMI